MYRRDFLKTSALSLSAILFAGGAPSGAADVDIFVETIETTIETNRLNKSSHLYLNQFYRPTPMVWVWTPYGWTIQAHPAYMTNTLSFQDSLHGYHKLTQRRKNIKQIRIHDADCIYILEDGSIKIYDSSNKKSNISSNVPNYMSGLRRVDDYYRNRKRTGSSR